MEGPSSCSGDAQTGHLGRAASTWLVFKKRASSLGLARRRKSRGGERRGNRGADDSRMTVSLDLADVSKLEGRTPFARPPTAATRRGESARELSIPKRLASTSAPVSYSFTTGRSGWMHTRLSRLFTRRRAEDTPAVPLVPRFSTQMLLPNKEAYFDDEEATVNGCSPLPGADHATDGGSAPLGPYLCKQCRSNVELESVHVDMRVDSEGNVRVHLQAVHALCWDSDKLLQRDASGGLLGATAGGKKKTTLPGWRCIMQLFTLCKQPQILE